MDPFLPNFYLNRLLLQRYYNYYKVKCNAIIFPQVSGNKTVSGSFNITYESGVTFSCSYSANDDGPSKFNYVNKGGNPRHYFIQPNKPEPVYVGDTTKISLSILSPNPSPLEYNFNIRNSTVELAHIENVSPGNWDPSLPSEIPIFETVSGTVKFNIIKFIVY